MSRAAGDTEGTGSPRRATRRGAEARGGRGTLAPCPRAADTAPNAVARSPSSPDASPGTTRPAHARAAGSSRAPAPDARRNSVPHSPRWTGTRSPDSRGSFPCSRRAPKVPTTDDTLLSTARVSRAAAPSATRPSPGRHTLLRRPAARVTRPLRRPGPFGARPDALRLDGDGEAVAPTARRGARDRGRGTEDEGQRTRDARRGGEHWGSTVQHRAQYARTSARPCGRTPSSTSGRSTSGARHRGTNAPRPSVERTSYSRRNSASRAVGTPSAANVSSRPPT